MASARNEPVAGRLIERAERFARNAHGSVGHRRKYSGLPYAVHLEAVARLVASVTGDEETIAAAWLHDVLEDTPVRPAELRRRFGASVAALVSELTDRSRPADGNRARRKAIDRAHLAAASPRAKTVKLADLIDNCRDITGRDPKFAALYLEEMRRLLEVLGEGDTRLLEEARRTRRECALSLGLDAPSEEEPGRPGRPHFSTPGASTMQRRMRRLLSEGIPAAYVAETLPSFDAEQPARNVRSFMEARGQEVVGVRREGAVTGYVRREDLHSGACGDRARPFGAEQTVFADASLAGVVQVLTHHDRCFVSVLGEVGAVIGREDFQKPPVRMWLFGMITILEMFFARSIEERFPEGEWEALLTPARLQKARSLCEERRKRGRRPRLVDCLQLADKAGILLKASAGKGGLGLETEKERRRSLKALESLRNSLAHGQDIVTHDWEAIVLIAGRLEKIVTRV